MGRLEHMTELLLDNSQGSRAYNVLAELDATFGEENADAPLGPIAEYSGAASRSELGGAEIVLAIPGESGGQATSTALAVLGPYPWPLRSLRVLSTADFDCLTDAMELPPLVSVEEAGRRWSRDEPSERAEGDRGQGAARDACGRHLGAAAVRG
ncbi:hypothetical protein [Rhodococcus oxybenzonivorans]|uniref:hypothetical protein n=1 Tax=Rhodococcus oxybenzonivorans TaxID=1990687 RepID=UPI001E450118|nr:hypothetical protein [Rhodococcus oxybenzonivorans]